MSNKPTDRPGDAPSTKRPNGDGRDSNTGRFAKGWKGGPGNPHARQVAEFRSAMLSAVTKEDLLAVIGSLVEKAKTGDVGATKLLLERLLGPIEALDVLARLDELDEKVTLLKANNGK
ncbi:MAG: hypothetical protein IID32_12955, partial [Planctomycetes bacterium]|nr:hypothetical protein [Planctomycetota bacterium]